MGRWPVHPVILEVNTWVWLDELSRQHGRRLPLGEVPQPVWDGLVEGVDAVWLMGVWERSPEGARIASTDPAVRATLEDALAGMTEEDIVGSPYCIRRYGVDARLGGDEGLAAARAALADRGVRLILDYVPNHVARDHPWTARHPDRFVRVERHDDVAAVDIAGARLALARDPHFPPWTDVVQLNAFSPLLRQATKDTLTRIAGMADGVRCDMAMLVVNEVFSRTWGDLVGAPPAEEFWPGVIGHVRARAPDFLFLAEAYWDYEATLVDHGFDHCYDKRFYDRLMARDPTALRAHLRADPQWQSRLVRFAENHDEPRAAASLPAEALPAALVATATVPGAALLYEGQLEGRRVRPPVQLGRRPHEPPDLRLADVGRRLLAHLGAWAIRQGSWTLCEVSGWPDNPSVAAVLAWAWTTSASRLLVVVNLSDEPVQGRIALPWEITGDVTFSDVLTQQRFTRDEVALRDEGMHVELPPWGMHVLAS